MRAIRQATTPESLFTVLQGWCRGGAAEHDHVIRVLSAFVSGGAVEVLEPLVDVFLSGGNRIEIIAGIDLGGTDKVALRRLHSLQRAYHGQVRVSVWDAPQTGSIFHPKLYVHECPRLLSAVVGSANLTLAGLGANLESLFLIEDCPRSSQDAEEILSVWNTFANPLPPLKPSFCRPLTSDTIDELISRIPARSGEDEQSSGVGRRQLWNSLSLIHVPASGRVRRRRPLPTSLSSYLVMDILDETRLTQVQPPAPVIERFFGVAPGEDATLRLSIITSEGLSQPIERMIVRSNYMRRIEVPQIRELERPCGIVFVRLPGAGRQFAYCVVARGTDAYARLDRLLRRTGEHSRERRFLIGRRNDGNWREVEPLLS